ncbi:MAG: HAD-IIB family hydrolase [Deltaproteobacteria bacterium]|nr:HAD-IIB family hydrolase [Deltaproteobacteria bacterium]
MSDNLPFFIIFTDLDATLLNKSTYGWKEALPAINLSKRLSVPVIFASSKTRAEISLLGSRMSISDPFISENGGGIFFQDRSFPGIPEDAVFDNGLWKLSLGKPYSLITKTLHEIRDDLGISIKGFSEMNIEEISSLTGLDQESSRLAALREYDEPFVIEEKKHIEKDELIKAAEKRGLSISAGGRFYHLHGKNDKGRAMTVLMSLYRKINKNACSIALGDSPNDFPMLKIADYPVLIRSENDYSYLKGEIQSLTITGSSGPKAWNKAVLNILENSIFWKTDYKT